VKTASRSETNQKEHNGKHHKLTS